MKDDSSTYATFSHHKMALLSRKPVIAVLLASFYLALTNAASCGNHCGYRTFRRRPSFHRQRGYRHLGDFFNTRPTLSRQHTDRHLRELFRMIHPIETWFSLQPEEVTNKGYPELAKSQFLSPKYSVVENDESYVISIDVPGIKSTDIRVTLEGGNVLRVRGVRTMFHGGKVAELERKFKIDHQRVDLNKVSVWMSNGVLSIRMPRHEQQDVNPIISIPVTEREQSGEDEASLELHHDETSSEESGYGDENGKDDFLVMAEDDLVITEND